MKSVAKEKPKEVPEAGRQLLRLVSSVNFLQNHGTLLFWKKEHSRARKEKKMSSIDLLISLVTYGQQSALGPNCNYPEGKKQNP